MVDDGQDDLVSHKAGRLRATTRVSAEALRMIKLVETHLVICPGGEIGRHASFRCWSSQGGGGSSPLLGTKIYFH